MGFTRLSSGAARLRPGDGVASSRFCVWPHCVLLLAVLPILPLGVALGTQGTWTVTGPGGQDVVALAVAADQSGVIYMAVGNFETRYYRSDDWGSNWKAVDHGLTCYYGVHSFAVDPRDPMVVYAQVEDCGLIRSSDGGDTWSEPSPTPIGRLFLNPSDPDRLYHLGASEVRVSEDGGISWSPEPILDQGVQALAFDPFSVNVLYAIRLSEILKSTDRGKTWGNITASLVDPVDKMVIDPNVPNTIYAFSLEAVFKTSNGGTSWQRQTTFADMGFEPTLTRASRGSPTRLFAISYPYTGLIHSSVDGGRSWQSFASNLPERLRPLLLEISGGTLPRVWVGSTGGLFSRISDQSLWQSHNLGFGRFGEVLGVAAGKPDWLYASGSQDFYRSRDGGKTWNPIRIPGYPGPMITHPTDPMKAWIAVLAEEGSRIYGTVDGGLSWVRKDTGFDGYASIGELIRDRKDPHVFYAGGDGAVFRSRDEGVTWTRVLESPYRFEVLVQDESSTGVLYAGAQIDGLWRSLDQGTTWVRLEGTSTIGRLAIDPRDPDLLYSVTFDSQVNRSRDGGKTWGMLSWPTGGGTVHDLVIDHLQSGVLYLSHRDGNVCMSRDGGYHWTTLQPARPDLGIAGRLLLTPERRLYAGTFTGEIWYLDLGQHLDLYFPQIADGHAPSGGSFRTTLQLVNQGDPTEAVVRFFKQAGEELELGLGDSVPYHEHRIGLARGESFSASTPGIGEVSVGYARISGGPGLAAALVYSYSENGITVFETGVPSADRVSEFAFLVEVSESEDNGFALVNTGDSPADVTLSLLDSLGDPVAARSIDDVLGGRRLPPGGHAARYVTEAFPEVGHGPFSGRVVVRSDQPLAAVVLRENDRPGLEFPEDIWTLSAFPALPTTMYPECCPRGYATVFPHVVDGLEGGVKVQTSLHFYRLSGPVDETWIQFVGEDGTPMQVGVDNPDAVYEPGTRSWIIEVENGALGSLRTEGIGPLQVGSLDLRKELKGLLFYTWSRDGVRLFETGVPASMALKSFTLFFDSIPDYLESAVAMVNLGTASADVTLRVYDRLGTLVASRTMVGFLPFNETTFRGTQKAKFIHELIPEIHSLGIREGVVTVDSTQPVAAVTLRQRDDPWLEFPDEVYLIPVFPVIPGRHDH